MRLWHIELLPVLPTKQLTEQLRECVAVGLKLYRNGKPDNIIVDRVADYPMEHFRGYCAAVIAECLKRGINVSTRTRSRLREYLGDMETEIYTRPSDTFPAWHNRRYLKQCLYNLQEKYDCGCIPDDEWGVIENHYKEELR